MRREKKKERGGEESGTKGRRPKGKKVGKEEKRKREGEGHERTRRGERGGRASNGSKGAIFIRINLLKI